MLLTVVMLLGLLPTAAFAVEEGTGEPSTAVAPAVIKLDSAKCEVGDEVTLNGSTTVSDGGMLSYQWMPTPLRMKRTTSLWTVRPRPL